MLAARWAALAAHAACFLPAQSFCAALHQELKEYYRLLSVLHSQVINTCFYFNFVMICRLTKLKLYRIFKFLCNQF